MLVSAEDIACHLLKKERILWKKAFIIKYFIFFMEFRVLKFYQYLSILKKIKLSKYRTNNVFYYPFIGRLK